jgi:hypothetical protein
VLRLISSSTALAALTWDQSPHLSLYHNFNICSHSLAVSCPMMHHHFSVRMRPSHLFPLPTLALIEDASSSCWKVPQQVSLPVPVMTLSQTLHCLKLLLRHISVRMWPVLCHFLSLPILVLLRCLKKLHPRRFSVCKWPVPSHFPAHCQHWLFCTARSSCSSENFHSNHVAYRISLPSPCQH